MQLGLFSGGPAFAERYRNDSGFRCYRSLRFSLVALEFLDIVSTKIVAIVWRGVGILGYHIPINVGRPYVWISDLCFKSALGVLVFGLGMKIASLLRH